MTESILRVCRGCGRYTLKARCPDCATETRTPHPARFSPSDRYGEYRRRLLAAASARPE